MLPELCVRGEKLEAGRALERGLGREDKGRGLRLQLFLGSSLVNLEN